GQVEGLTPFPPPRLQQFPLANAEGVAAFLGKVGGSQRALRADELGPFGVAVLFQPVGKDQARGVVIGVRRDRPEERLLLGHGSPPLTSPCPRIVLAWRDFPRLALPRWFSLPAVPALRGLESRAIPRFCPSAGGWCERIRRGPL